MFPNGLLTYILSDNSPQKKFIFNLKLTLIKEISIFTSITKWCTNFFYSKKFTRSAGAFSLLLKKNKKYTLIRLKSGAHRLFLNNNIGVLGTVSNDSHFLTDLSKAGTSRLLGRRPIVRACSKNPVDHPLGGRTVEECILKIKMV